MWWNGKNNKISLFYCSSDYFWPGYLLKSSSFLRMCTIVSFFFHRNRIFISGHFLCHAKPETKEETFILHLVFVTNNSKKTSLIRLTYTIFHEKAQNREIIQIKIGHSICIQIKFIEHDRFEVFGLFPLWISSTCILMLLRNECHFDSFNTIS